MYIKPEVKQLIIEEYESFKNKMYAESPEEIRTKLGQFFTPADVSLQMLELLETDSLSGREIIDPTSGSGNLLAAALIAGADSDKVFGNEYDPRMVDACRKRLNKVCDMLGKPHIKDWQIHQGNALIPDCLTEFGPDYDNTILKELLKKRWGLKGGWIDNPEHYKEAEQGNLFEDFLGGN